MSSAYGNLVVQNTSTVGTGTLTLTTAVSPYLTANQAGFNDGWTVSYSIVDTTNSVSEAGVGVLSNTQTQLTRNVKTSSSNNALVSLSGFAIVRLTPLAHDLNSLNALIHAAGGLI